VRPTECNDCGLKFNHSHLMQAEVQHTFLTQSEKAAQLKADELLQEYHDGGH